MASTPRRCYWIDETQVARPDGFIPSIVIEDDPGHYPLVGDEARFQAPWVWGPTLQEALVQADAANLAMGITVEAAIAIVSSSMAA